jgi:hypothetical protein
VAGEPGSGRETPLVENFTSGTPWKEGVTQVSTDGSPLYTITTSASPGAGGTATGGGSFTNGASVTVRAIANPGYELVSWTDGGVAASTESDYTFTADASRTLVANFAPRLSIATTRTNTFVISWTASSPGFVLQEKLVVDGSVGWSDTPEPIRVVGGQNQVTIFAPGKSLFYRLYHP